MKRTLFQLCLAAAGLTMLLAVSGCNTVRPAQVRHNMTPALATADSTRAQKRNDIARVIDHNTRTAWDDFYRLMLLDEATPLSPYSIP
ncbi:MAG: hypothetical protein IT445_04180 [Phycisphaeraceae bacterium]|nr:hypothetical protein [Phycisphaeraceae bacterium]